MHAETPSLTLAHYGPTVLQEVMQKQKQERIKLWLAALSYT